MSPRPEEPGHDPETPGWASKELARVGRGWRDQMNEAGGYSRRALSATAWVSDSTNVPGPSPPRGEITAAFHWDPDGRLELTLRFRDAAGRERQDMLHSEDPFELLDRVGRALEDARPPAR